MHAEELKHKPIGTVAGIFLTLGIVFGVLLLIFIFNFLQFWLGINWLTILLYAIVILAAIFIVKYMLTEYIYLIEKDRLSYGRRIGRKEKELLFIPLRDVTAFGPYAELEQKIGKTKKYRYTFKKKQDWFVVMCDKCAVIMSPTPEYIDCLKNARNKRSGSNENANT